MRRIFCKSNYEEPEHTQGLDEGDKKKFRQERLKKIGHVEHGILPEQKKMQKVSWELQSCDDRIETFKNKRGKQTTQRRTLTRRLRPCGRKGKQQKTVIEEGQKKVQ